MGYVRNVLAALRGQPRAEGQGQITSSKQLADWVLAQGFETSSGLDITPEKALGHPAVWSSLRVIGESVGQLPLQVFKRGVRGQRNQVENHPIEKLLGVGGQPNSWSAPFLYKETMARQSAWRGNHYALKNRVRGEVRELLPVHPKRMTPAQDENFNLTYTVSMPNGPARVFGPSEILHLRGPSDDGIVGLDVFKVLKDTLGLGVSQELEAARIFRNAAKLSVVLEREGPGELSPEAYERLVTSFDAKYGGVGNAYKTVLLEDGVKAKPTQQTAQEAQTLEARKFFRTLVAAIWRVPPHLINELEHATFSNIENMARQFVDYALMPWLERFEDEFALQLMTRGERERGLYVKFNPDALLRGNLKDRMEAYLKGLQGTIWNPNEVREREDLPPRDGGDEYKNPMINPEPETDDQGKQPVAEDRP